MEGQPSRHDPARRGSPIGGNDIARIPIRLNVEMASLTDVDQVLPIVLIGTAVDVVDSAYDGCAVAINCINGNVGSEVKRDSAMLALVMSKIANPHLDDSALPIRRVCHQLAFQSGS